MNSSDGTIRAPGRVARAYRRTPDVDEEDKGAMQEEAIRNRENISESEREQLIRARLGHGKFRLSVQQFEKTCRVSGIWDLELLQATHMKPWTVCSNAERLDGANGLLLAPSFCLLFDKGYISFDESGHLLVSKRLADDVVQTWCVKQMAVPQRFLKPQLEYLEFHAARIFRA